MGYRVALEIPPRQASWLKSCEDVTIQCKDAAGSPPLKGRLTLDDRTSGQGGHDLKANVAITDPGKHLQPGMIVDVTCRVPVSELEPFRSLPADPPPLKPGEPRQLYTCPEHPDLVGTQPGRCTIDGNALEARPLSAAQRVRWWCPMHPDVVADRPGERCGPCGGMMLKPRAVSYRPHDKVLAVPESAVVDSGIRTVVFIETMPGMFDGVEVTLGPPCGDCYPVVKGLEPGQKVAVSGAFLLDAETRLNPSLASSYFGAAGRSPASSVVTVAASSPDRSPLAKLEANDRLLAERQKICPVTGKPLGSMGTPYARGRRRSCRLPLLRWLQGRTRGGTRPISCGTSRTAKPMIDAIIKFSIRHRGLVIAACFVLASLGVWAAWRTPVDAIPDLSENQVIVFTDWKGHSPREIEDQITYPLSLGLQGVSGVRVVRSSSDVGFSMISVIFEDGLAFDEARSPDRPAAGKSPGPAPRGCRCGGGSRLPRHRPDLLVHRRGARP